MSDQTAMVLWVTVAVFVTALFTLLVVSAADAADRRERAAGDQSPSTTRGVASMPGVGVWRLRREERSMSYAETMLGTTQSQIGHPARELAACVDACIDCAQACTACADACLAEDQVTELRRCITLDHNCADVCESTARILSRQTGYDAEVTRAVLEACRMLCRLCREECERHAAMHEHCGVCAEACRRCEDACQRLLAA
jgi:hypothetical protein